MHDEVLVRHPVTESSSSELLPDRSGSSTAAASTSFLSITCSLIITATTLTPLIMDTELRQRGKVSTSKRSQDRTEDKKKSPSGLSRWIRVTVVVIVSLVLLMTVVCPVVFRSSMSVRKSLLFMNWLNLPLFRNLSNPEAEFGLNCTRHFYITDDRQYQIGTWHILPKSRIAECDLRQVSRLPEGQAFADNRPVVLYLHGNGGARGGNHRKELYKLLAYQLDYHVLAIDYRGYGDSSPVTPTATGLVDDAAVAYDWLLSHVARERIVIWGHSLGTAVAAYLVSRTEPISQPSSVVLEAPLNTVADAVRNHPTAVLFAWHPFFEYFFVEPVVTNAETNYDTESKIRHIHSHLLILHAEDDMILPFELGKKLFQTAEKTRPSAVPRPQFVSFESSKKYGHKAIFRDPQLPDIISKFVLNSRISKPHN